jgi:uncharacterized membrane protein YjgN (DUF898 family)
MVATYRLYLEKVRGGIQAARVASPALEPGPPPPVGAPPAAVGRTRRLFFHGQGGSLLGIYLVNVFLTLATLGVYAFWARVRVRTYLFGQTEFEGDRFAYHGTGRELLFGYLRAGLVFGVPFLSLQYVPVLLDSSPVVQAVTSLLAYGVISVFIPVAMVGARRYRLSRTSWRGIRFSFRGRTLEFVKLFVGGGLLTSLTLGFYYPIWITKRQAFLVSHTCFGSQRFGFDGEGRDLRRRFLLAVLLFLPTLGLSWIWFSAAKQRYFAAHTSFTGARLHSTVTGGGLLLLTMLNLLAMIVTVGLAFPWIIARTLRVTFDWLSIRGALDLDGIGQQPQAASATGEGLAGFFDAGFDLG